MADPHDSETLIGEKTSTGGSPIQTEAIFPVRKMLKQYPTIDKVFPKLVQTKHPHLIFPSDGAVVYTTPSFAVSYVLRLEIFKGVLTLDEVAEYLNGAWISDFNGLYIQINKLNYKYIFDKGLPHIINIQGKIRVRDSLKFSPETHYTFNFKENASLIIQLYKNIEELVKCGQKVTFSDVHQKLIGKKYRSPIGKTYTVGFDDLNRITVKIITSPYLEVQEDQVISIREANYEIPDNLELPDKLYHILMCKDPLMKGMILEDIYELCFLSDKTVSINEVKNVLDNDFRFFEYYSLYGVKPVIPFCYCKKNKENLEKKSRKINSEKTDDKTNEKTDEKIDKDIDENIDKNIDKKTDENKDEKTDERKNNKSDEKTAEITYEMANEINDEISDEENDEINDKKKDEKKDIEVELYQKSLVYIIIKQLYKLESPTDINSFCESLKGSEYTERKRTSEVSSDTFSEIRKILYNLPLTIFLDLETFYPIPKESEADLFSPLYANAYEILDEKDDFMRHEVSERKVDFLFNIPVEERLFHFDSSLYKNDISGYRHFKCRYNKKKDTEYADYKDSDQKQTLSSSSDEDSVHDSKRKATKLDSDSDSEFYEGTKRKKNKRGRKAAGNEENEEYNDKMYKKTGKKKEKLKKSTMKNDESDSEDISENDSDNFSENESDDNEEIHKRKKLKIKLDPPPYNPEKIKQVNFTEFDHYYLDVKDKEEIKNIKRLEGLSDDEYIIFQAIVDHCGLKDIRSKYFYARTIATYLKDVKIKGCIIKDDKKSAKLIYKICSDCKDIIVQKYRFTAILQNTTQTDDHIYSSFSEMFFSAVEKVHIEQKIELPIITKELMAESMSGMRYYSKGLRTYITFSKEMPYPQAIMSIVKLTTSKFIFVEQQQSFGLIQYCPNWNGELPPEYRKPPVKRKHRRVGRPSAPNPVENKNENCDNDVNNNQKNDDKNKTNDFSDDYDASVPNDTNCNDDISDINRFIENTVSTQSQNISTKKPGKKRGPKPKGNKDNTGKKEKSKEKRRMKHAKLVIKPGTPPLPFPIQLPSPDEGNLSAVSNSARLSSSDNDDEIIYRKHKLNENSSRTIPPSKNRQIKNRSISNESISNTKESKKKKQNYILDSDSDYNSSDIETNDNNGNKSNNNNINTNNDNDNNNNNNKKGGEFNKLNEFRFKEDYSPWEMPKTSEHTTILNEPMLSSKKVAKIVINLTDDKNGSDIYSPPEIDFTSLSTKRRGANFSGVGVGGGDALSERLLSMQRSAQLTGSGLELDEQLPDLFDNFGQGCNIDDFIDRIFFHIGRNSEFIKDNDPNLEPKI